MLFWGWRRKTRKWDLGNGYQLVCAYKYLHIYFILRFITQKKWYLIGDSRAEDRELTKEEVGQLLPDGMPHISAYGKVGETAALKVGKMPIVSKVTKTPADSSDKWTVPQ
jgi:hypothetical protein